MFDFSYSKQVSELKVTVGYMTKHVVRVGEGRSSFGIRDAEWIAHNVQFSSHFIKIRSIIGTILRIEIMGFAVDTLLIYEVY